MNFITITNWPIHTWCSTNLIERTNVITAFEVYLNLNIAVQRKLAVPKYTNSTQTRLSDHVSKGL